MAKQNRGKGWHGDSIGHAKAGKKGGEVTAAQRGQAFYSEIGRKGGKSSSKKSATQSDLDIKIEEDIL